MNKKMANILTDILLFLIFWITMFISLFSSFNLSLLYIVCISLIYSIITILIYNKLNSKNKIPLILLILFIFSFIILGFNVLLRSDWYIESLFTLLYLLVLIFPYKKFKFSLSSYILFFTFLFLHTLGVHYTYSQVPFGFWLDNLFNLGRNHFDRIVHFLFGFLLVFPMYELFTKKLKLKGIWLYILIISFLSVFSMIYEILEMLVTLFANPDLGNAFLAAQGDYWDSQKDMLCALVGSIISSLILFTKNKFN